MALPYPTKVVLPFDIATAQDMNERHANDVALANGTGLSDGAVTSDKLAPSKTTDANGWTVYNYGTWKQYEKHGTVIVTVPANSWNRSVATSLPSGTTAADISSISLIGSFVEVSVFSVGGGSSTNFEVACHSKYGSSLNCVVTWSCVIVK